MSGEGLSGSKTAEDNKRREKEKTVEQKKDSRRQSVQQEIAGGRVCNKRGKWVSAEGFPGGKSKTV